MAGVASLQSLLCCFFILCVFLQEITCIQHTPVVTIHSGQIRGRIDKLNTGGAVRKYLGIPFAKAERFAQPTDPEPWSDVKDTVDLGKICPQPESSYAKLVNMSEDCLNLNVFVPDGAASSLPVMVWIHGGSFRSGSNRYDGSYIASLGHVIVVTIHYRLNVFGFIAMGKDSDLKGNYGMYDQMYALKWVQKNIKQFGGDASKVTIFGVSAGAASVSHLVISPLAKGLFQNAIAQAGDATADWAYKTYKEASATAKTIGRDLGCNEVNMLAACMKKKTIKDIVKTAIGRMLNPVVGGRFLPADSPETLLASEKIDVNMIIGFNNDEGSVATGALRGTGSGSNITNGITRSDFVNFVRHYNKIAVLRGSNKFRDEAMLYRYTDWNNVMDPYRNRRMFLDMFSDLMFLAPAIKSAKILAQRNVTVYMYQIQYRFDTRAGNPVPSWIRAYHAADKAIIFGEPFMQAALHNTSVFTKNSNFSRAVITLWTNFAKTGDPNSPNSPGLVWPQYDVKQQQYLAIKPNMSVQSKLRAEYMAFWNNFIPHAIKMVPTPPPTRPPPSVPSSGSTVTINGLMSSVAWFVLFCIVL